jgi:hypothetical protein
MNLQIENKNGLTENMFLKVLLDKNNNYEQICKTLQLNEKLKLKCDFDLKDKEFKNLYKRELLLHIYRTR